MTPLSRRPGAIWILVMLALTSCAETDVPEKETLDAHATAPLRGRGVEADTLLDTGDIPGVIGFYPHVGRAYALRVEHSDKCASAYGLNNDSPATQFPCSGNDYQLFRFLPQPTGDYLVAHVASGKCLDVAGWSVHENAPLQLWTCHGGANQRFTYRMRGVGKIELVNTRSHKCVTVDDAATHDGARIVQNECMGASYAYQTLIPEPVSVASPEWGRLANGMSRGSEAVRSAYFFVGSSKGTLGHTYRAFDDRHYHWDLSAENRAFAVDRMAQAGINVVLMSTWGRGAELDAANRWAPTWITETSRDQLFDLAAERGMRVAPVVETTIPHFALVNEHTGTCLHVPGGSLDTGTRLDAATCDYGSWSFQFRVQKPHWVDENDVNTGDDTYREVRVHASAKCLDVRAFGTTEGTPVQQWDCNDATNQVFDVQLVDESSGAFRFRDVHSGKCLQVDTDGWLVIATCGQSSRQRFFVFHAGGGQDTGLIWEKRYSIPDELGRWEQKASPAPYLEDQVTALLEHYVTQPDNPAWPGTWAQITDRNGEPRRLVYLMFAKSSDTRLRHHDWKWAADLQKVADNIYDRTGVRVGFTLDTAPGLDYGAFWQYYNVNAMAGAPALWRYGAFLGIQPYSPESFFGNETMNDFTRAEMKRGFYEDWLRTGVPVILGMVPYYRIELDGQPPLDGEPLFGTTDEWIQMQTQMLEDLPVQGIMYTAWNGYDEGYTGVVGKNFQHDPDAPLEHCYTRFYSWAQEIFTLAAGK